MKYFLAVPLMTVFASLVTLSSHAMASSDGLNYPEKPIRLIVPFAPGGPNDTVARLMTPKLSEELGQPVVVENRGGAGGVIGTDAVVKAEADGYVIGISSAGALAISKSVQSQMPYDTLTDLAPITLIATVPELLVTSPIVEAQTLPELIQWAKDNPGYLNYASSGPGGMQHLAGEMLNYEAGIDTVHIPYRGAAPAVLDVVGGQVDMMFADLPILLSQVKEGALRPIAVGSKTRSPALPDIPTTAEMGLANVVAENWYGIVAPQGTPDAILETLHAAFNATLTDPDVVDALELQGLEIIASSPEEFSDYIAQETQRWADVVEATGAILQ